MKVKIEVSVRPLLERRYIYISRDINKEAMQTDLVNLML